MTLTLFFLFVKIPFYLKRKNHHLTHHYHIMPGPKMGPRPADFDEALIRQSPTFGKWLQLQPGKPFFFSFVRFEFIQ